MALPDKTKSLIKKYLMRGFILAFPGIFSLWLFDLIFGIADKVVGPITRGLLSLLPDWMLIGPLADGSPFLSFILLILLVTVLGGFVSWRYGKAIVVWFEDQIIKIPGYGKVYKNMREMARFFDTEKGSPFQKVVVIPYPHPGVFTKGFVAGSCVLQFEDGEEDCHVVVVPNPPTGVQGICYVPKRLCLETEETVEDGLQFYVSLGVVAAERLVVKGKKTMTAIPAPPSS